MTDNHDPHLGRREYDTLDVVDTANKLTLEELQELKKLAQLSRSTRVVIGILFAVVAALGVPNVIEWFHKHWV